MPATGKFRPFAIGRKEYILGPGGHYTSFLKQRSHMEIEHVMTFNLALIAAILSPGPAFLYSVQTSLQSGRRAGVFAGLGLAVMAATWTMMALLGVNGLFVLFPWAFLLFKTGGALYLIYIAWKTWSTASKPVCRVEKPNTTAFKGGFLINLANPKSVLFAAALIVVVFPMELSGLEKTIVIANHFLVEFVVYCSFAFVMSTQSIGNRYLQAKTVFDRFSAIVLGGLGVRLLLDQRH